MKAANSRVSTLLLLSKIFYTHLERNLEADMVKLRAYKSRDDVATYEGMLRTVIGFSDKALYHR